jgi:hypothetical protein
MGAVSETTFFLRVPEHVARNPVARAVAKARVRQAVLDFRLALYGLPDGSEQRANMQAAAQVLCCALRICEVRKEMDRTAVMRGAMSGLIQRSKDGIWREADAVAVDVAMGHALDVINGATAGEVQEAWIFVQRLSDEAVAQSAP